MPYCHISGLHETRVESGAGRALELSTENYPLIFTFVSMNMHAARSGSISRLRSARYSRNPLSPPQRDWLNCALRKFSVEKKHWDLLHQFQLHTSDITHTGGPFHLSVIKMPKLDFLHIILILSGIILTFHLSLLVIISRQKDLNKKIIHFKH